MEIAAFDTSKMSAKTRDDTENQLRLAKEFEASFLAEMLKYSGINKTSESFGGGAGEDAFSSMLNDAYANALVEAGGIGITEVVYQSIVEKLEKSEG